MIIPIQHENMSARRWPIVTLALILVNFVIFAATHRVVDEQDSRLWGVREHILILAATHPSLLVAPDAKPLSLEFRVSSQTNGRRYKTPMLRRLTTGMLEFGRLTTRRHCRRKWIRSEPNTHD